MSHARANTVTIPTRLIVVLKALASAALKIASIYYGFAAIAGKMGGCPGAFSRPYRLVRETSACRGRSQRRTHSVIVPGTHRHPRPTDRAQSPRNREGLHEAAIPLFPVPGCATRAHPRAATRDRYATARCDTAADRDSGAAGRAESDRSCTG